MCSPSGSKPLPAGEKAVIYRARTKVARRSRGPATAPTFTLSRAIDLIQAAAARPLASPS